MTNQILNTFNKEELSLSGFGLRFAALLLDAILVFLAIIIFARFTQPLAAYTLELMADESNNSLVVITVAYVAKLLFLSLVSAIMESSKMKGTIGKYVLKINVVRKNNEGLSFSKAFIRNIVKYLSVGILFPVLIVGLFTKREQTLHDFLVNSYVVRRPRL